MPSLCSALLSRSMPSLRIALLCCAVPLLCSSQPYSAMPSLRSVMLCLSVATLIFFALSRICKPYLAAFIALPMTRRCMSLTFSVLRLASVISCFLPSAVTTAISLSVLIGTQQHAGACCYHADSQQCQHDNRAGKQVDSSVLGHTAGYQRSEKAHSCKPSVTFVGHLFQSPFAVSCNPRT